MHVARGTAVFAVLRADGVLLPFAVFDGDAWSSPWPATVRGIDIPASLDDVPEEWWGVERPASWKLWPARGSPVTIVPQAPLIVHVGRGRRLGVRSDFKPSLPPVGPFELPYPKEGLVIGGEIEVADVPSVSKLAPQFRDLAAMLREDINRAEKKSVDSLRGSMKWRHPVPEDERAKVMPEIEAWYTTQLAQPGFGVSYIEAVKRYPPGPEDEGCGLETFVRGWIHTNARTPDKRVTDLTARITYCDRVGVSYMLPLGRVTVQGRTHWIFQSSSHENEWYAVARFEPGRVRFVVEYFAGSRVPD